MLRLGMRYSKTDPTKAASIAQEAFAGGVILYGSVCDRDDTFILY